MPEPYSPQAHARTARSALLNALSLLDPICRAGDDDGLIDALSFVEGELTSAHTAASRALARAQADAAMNRVVARELVQ